jgi:transcriptional repressor NrdR
MRCPKCGCVDDKVIDSRSSKDGLAIRRRRECLKCSQRYTTYEEIERGNLMVIKDGGARERFSRDKLEAGINIACQKRPVSAEAIEQMIREVVDELYDEFDGEVPSKAIGRKVMEKLKQLDGVAYVRFASVYWRFDSAAEFLEAVQKFGDRDDTTTIKLPGF